VRPDPQRFVETLLPALREAAALARSLEGRVENRPKAGESTPAKAALTRADFAAQEAILQPLLQHFPGVALEAEEDTQSARLFPAQGDVRVVVDPIDGTLRSYLQAIVIMLTIPFGYVGAVFGHWILDFQMSFLSTIGVMACAGVVVNDSLVLVTFMNRMRDEGAGILEAAQLAGGRRFRPIMLTSLTTFAGLLPVMLESSAQAQFVKPMAISLGFGVGVATAFTLLMIPAAMVIVDDGKRFWQRLKQDVLALAFGAERV